MVSPNSAPTWRPNSFPENRLTMPASWRMIRAVGKRKPGSSSMKGHEMKQMRTCATVVFALVSVAAMAWGQDSTTEKPKAAQGVEVKVTRIQETRSRDFGQEMSGQISSTQVSLTITGGQAAKANKYGKLKIEKAVDDKETDLSLKEN